MNEELLAKRQKRLDDAVALKEADMVPIAPKTGYYFATGYGISYYDVMMDLRNILPGLNAYLDTYDPELVWSPILYPIPPMEALGTTFIKWPGARHNLPLNVPFQIMDKTFVEDDEILEFAHDPTHFILTKVFPRKFSNLAGFRKLFFRNAIEYSQFIDFSVFTDPEVKAAIEAATRGGEEILKWLGGLGILAQAMLDKGFIPGPAGAQTCPYDMWSDNFRGLMQTLIDIKERPDELEIVLDSLTKICIERTVANGKAMGMKYVFIPLHGGVDEFMSQKDYDRFYWKGLKALMDALIENDMIPYVFCEGNYNLRLERIAEVPKGKVIYMFEKADIAKVKKIVGPSACFSGNVPSAMMLFGTPEQVRDEVKRQLDICAPGGGFMMDVSIDFTGAKPENVDAFFETTRLYGKY